MMKTNKLFAMAMALTMASTAVSSISSFAADEKIEKDDHYAYTVTDINVTADAKIDGTVQPALYGGSADAVEEEIIEKTQKESKPKIYVEVEWQEMKFEYDFGTVDEYEWNLETLEYDAIYKYEDENEAKEPGWIKNSKWIKFTNYSNRNVYTGVSFEKNPNTKVYEDVTVSFDRDEVELMSAVERETLDSQYITMTLDGAPFEGIDQEDTPALGVLKFYISELTRIAEDTPEEEPAPEEESGEHVCHYTYDQFGRLRCTGCGALKHEYCIDEDEDGLCDVCGLDRDFCPDCHIGGTCKCT